MTVAGTIQKRYKAIIILFLFATVIRIFPNPAPTTQPKQNTKCYAKIFPTGLL